MSDETNNYDVMQKKSDLLKAASDALLVAIRDFDGAAMEAMRSEVFSPRNDYEDDMATLTADLARIRFQVLRLVTHLNED